MYEGLVIDFALEEDYTLPKTIEIAVYPNPFNSEVNFRISQLRPEKSYRVEMYDLLGRRIRLLESDIHRSKNYTVRWDGKTDQGTDAGSGVYFIKVRSGGIAAQQKVTLIR